MRRLTLWLWNRNITGTKVYISTYIDLDGNGLCIGLAYYTKNTEMDSRNEILN